MPRPTRIRYLVLAAGCGLGLLTYIQRQGFVRAIPEIRKSLDLDDQQVGYLATAFLVAYGAFQVPCGLLGDRLGARHLLTILVLGWSVLTAATALVVFLPAGVVWTFVLLLCVRFLFGVFQAGGFPVWARVVADWVPLPERASVQGTVWMFSRIGGAISPFLFLWLFQYFETWSTPLVVLAGLGVLWCALFWPWFRNRPEEMMQVNEAERQLIAFGRALPASDSAPSEIEQRPLEPITAAQAQESIRSGPPPLAMDPALPSIKREQPAPIPWSQMFRSPSVWGLCLMYGFVGFSGNFFTNLLPNYLDKNRELTPEMTTLLTSLPLALGVVSCALGGFLSDWMIRRWQIRTWGRRLVGGAGLILAGLAILTVPWSGPTWLLAVALGASFFGNDMMLGPAWASRADIGGRCAGTLSGAMNMTGNLFGAAGMAFAGWMLHRKHVDLLFIIFACSYALAALSWLAVDVTKPLEREPSDSKEIP